MRWHHLWSSRWVYLLEYVWHNYMFHVDANHRNVLPYACPTHKPYNGICIGVGIAATLDRAVSCTPSTGSSTLAVHQYRTSQSPSSACAAAALQVAISVSRLLGRYARRPDLNARMPGFRVQMGFGLHVGWAIEGAIGEAWRCVAGGHRCPARPGAWWMCACLAVYSRPGAQLWLY